MEDGSRNLAAGVVHGTLARRAGQDRGVEPGEYRERTVAAGVVLWASGGGPTTVLPDGRWLVSPTFRQFFMIGVCGGYTTFSSFSLQTLALAQEGEWFRAAANSVFNRWPHRDFNLLNQLIYFSGDIIATLLRVGECPVGHGPFNNLARGA